MPKLQITQPYRTLPRVHHQEVDLLCCAASANQWTETTSDNVPRFLIGQSVSDTGKDPVPILQQAGWATGPVWTGGKSRRHRDSIPDRPARSQSLYRLSYPAHNKIISIHIYMYIYICVCVYIYIYIYIYCLGTHLHRTGIRPDPLLHAMQPPRTHGQKPPRTVYRTT